MSQTTDREPILASWKISDVIRQYPQLVDELVAINPTFRLLRNPVMRRVQSRLVTVAQAAQIAGMEPAVLVQALNRAAGLTPPVTPGTVDSNNSATVAVAPPWVETAPVAAEVDARPLQREGVEPFSAIMAAARQVERGQVLRLLNTFEPVPLYDVLGQRGFEHWAREIDGGDWEILFFHSGQVARPSGRPRPAPPTPPSEGGWESPTATITIDVSELVPPEPMIRILEALEELPDGGSLLVHHVRRPMHLYPRLDELGYAHQTRDLAPGRVEVLIEKPVVGEAGDA